MWKLPLPPVGARKLLLVALLVAAVSTPWLLTPSPAGSCSCASVPGPARVERSEAVVVGEVKGPPVPSDDLLVYPVDVERYLKDRGPPSIYVHTPSDSCRFGAETSERYLLFLKRGETGKLFTGLCSLNEELGYWGSNRVLRHVQEVTGPGRPPDGLLPRSIADAPAHWLWIGGAGAAVAALAAAILVVRKREDSHSRAR